MSEARPLKLLLDTNIVVDFINHRECFYDSARLLMICGKVGEFGLWVSSSQITDILFIASDGGKEGHIPEVLEKLRLLRRYLNIYEVTSRDIDSMLATTGGDPEDALVLEAALQLNADAIITRDVDFPGRDLVNTFDCPGFFKWMEDKYGISYAEIAV